MPQPLQRRSFLALLAGFFPAALALSAHRPSLASDNPHSAVSKTLPAVERTPQYPAPLLPPPDQPPFDTARLARWQAAARHPITDSSDPLLARLLMAARAGVALDVLYYGGTFPGTVRRVSPLVLFTVDGFSGTYLEARCHWRREIRTFNTARLAFEPLRLV